MKNLKEIEMKYLFLAAACVSILAVALICIFLFANGIPTIAKIGPFNFLLGKEWKPLSEVFGIFPMILGSIYVTAGAMIIGIPIGVLTAIFMSQFCNRKIYRFIKPAIELLVGIPSIVYGFFGLVVIVPIIQDLYGGSGKGILAASILLGIMILPTIINVTEASLNAVPSSYYEGSLALGATHERSVFCVIVPAAKSGVLSAVILGVGRAIGETMALIMVAGNSPAMPEGLLSSVRTLTSNIVMEMGYAQGLHREALIATAVVLFVFILMIDFAFSVVKNKAAKQN